MKENGERLTGKKVKFGGFVVLRHPIIDPLNEPWLPIIIIVNNLFYVGKKKNIYIHS